MSRKCEVSGKKAIKGWRYSFLRAHNNPTAKRRFQVNLQTIRTKDENGTPIKVKVSTSVIKKNPGIKSKITNIQKKGSRRKLKKLLATLEK